MNLLRFLMIYTICQSLVISPISWAQIAVDPNAAAPVVDHSSQVDPGSGCPAGQYYDSESNLCKTNTDVAEATADASRCAELPEDQRQACHDGAANTSLDESGMEAHRNSVKSSTILASLNLAIGTYAVFNTLPNNCDASASFALMRVAAILNAVNEMGTHLWYKLGLKGLQNDYSDLVDEQAHNADEDNPAAQAESNEDSKRRAVDAQTQAYDFVAKKEKLFKTVAHTKGGIYITVAVLYAAAMVVTIFEAAAEKIPYTAAYYTPINNCETQGTKVPNIALLLALGLPALIEMVDRPLIKGIKPINKISVPEYLLRKTPAYYLENSSSALESYVYHKEYEAMNSGATKSMSIEEYEILQGAFIFDTQMDNMVSDSLKLSVALKRIISNLTISSSHAVEPVTTVLGSEALGKAADGVRTFLGSAAGRIIISGSLSTVAGISGAHAIKQGNLAKDRQEYMEGLVAHFNNNASQTISVCTSYDRGNPLTPKCYCYNEDMSKNTQREQSFICKERWAKNPSLNPTDYSDKEDPNNTEPKFCANSKDRFDYKCSCAVKGKCSSILSRIKFPNFAQGFMSNIAKESNALLGGKLGGAGINTAKQIKQAAKLRDMAEQMKEQKKDVIGAGLASTAKRMGPLLKRYPKSVMKAYAKSSGMGAKSTSGLAPQIAKQIEDKMKKEGLDGAVSALKYEKAGAKKKTAKADEGFSFNFNEEGGGSGNIKVEGGANQDKFTYGKDIAVNQDSETDIFKILSFRYKKSALRRIFGNKEQQNKHDDAGTTDINR